MKTTIWIGVFIILTCGSIPVHAQATFEQAIDSSYMLIGSQQRLHVRCADERMGDKIFDVLDTLKWLEIVDKGVWNRQADLVNREVLFTVFDSGVFRIPPLGIDPHSDSLHMLGNPLILEVAYPRDSLTALRPIKAIIETKDNNGLIWKMVIFSFLILAMLFVLWQFFKADRTKPPHIRISTPKSPAQLALDALRKLKEEKYPEKGMWKDYCDELTFILRSFISEGLLIPALEKTSAELIAEMDRSAVAIKHVDFLPEFLRSADLVKFANVIPPYENGVRWFQFAEDFINTNGPSSERLLESRRMHFLRLLGPETANQFDDPEQMVPRELMQLYQGGSLSELDLYHQLVRKKSFKLPQEWIDWHLSHTGSFYRWQRIILSIHPNTAVRLAVFAFVLPFVTLFMPVLFIVAKWNKESLMERGVFGLSSRNKLIVRNLTSK